MRFIGNKELITAEIADLLDKKGLLGKELKFFDACCGTGAVADSLKDSFNIIANDILKWSVLYTKARLSANKCRFSKLGFDPFVFFNGNDKKIKGFFYKNYSPGGSERRYFSGENAARIDYFRITIEDWKSSEKITEIEYNFLLACLIESTSLVSNTAGVYGAYLKHWDPRSQRPIRFISVPFRDKPGRRSKYFNGKIEEIIEKVDCDILFLDPPYTQNQYGTQYHLLETLILYDNPSISPITGSRKTAPMRSDWSKNFKAHILFDYILSKTTANYIVVTYSIDGLMSKSFLEASLKRYGIPESYVCKKISFKKYKNFKSRGNKEHFEYLFFIEKRRKSEVVYESPLNFIGSKARMVQQIRELLPKKFDSFIDAFGGGLNVGVNINAKHVIYNDYNYLVKELIESFKNNDTYQYLLYIRKIIRKYSLKAAEPEGYLKARNYYNSLTREKRDPKLLYTILLYGYNQQIRFNSLHDFNNPVGMRWFNDKVLEKMISFSRVLKEKDLIFLYEDYVELIKKISPGTFVYMDPPFMLTTSSYNDGKRGFNGWNNEAEKVFLSFADQLDDNNIKFMISYVLEHKGKANKKLKSWIKSRGYKVIPVKVKYAVTRKEVLIINYE